MRWFFGVKEFEIEANFKMSCYFIKAWGKGLGNLTIKSLELTIMLSRLTIKSGIDDYLG